MRRIITAAAAAGLLVAGAFVATTITSDSASAQVIEAQVDETQTDTERPERGAHVVEVLDTLVADGTLTQAQADAVQEALAAKAEELRAEREERRAERQAAREVVREMLEDGVIDAGELAELGDDHPFNDPDGRFAEAAADGQITEEELKEIAQEHRGHRRGGPSSDEASGDNA